MLVRLGEEGDIAVLVIEQNIGVATSVSDSVAIMVNGRVNRVIDSRAPGRRPRAAAAAARRRPSCRSRGGGRSGGQGDARRHAGGAAPDERRAGAHLRLQSEPPTRWSQPVPIARIEAGRAHDLDRRAQARGGRAAAPRHGCGATSGPPTVLVVGTLDTKGQELRFIRDIVAGSGLRARLVDVSTSRQAATCDVTAQEIALNHGRGGSGRVRRGSRRVGRPRWPRPSRLGPPTGRYRRHHLRRRLGRRLDRRAGHARPADRRAQSPDLLGRLRRRRRPMSARATSR